MRRNQTLGYAKTPTSPTATSDYEIIRHNPSSTTIASIARGETRDASITDPQAWKEAPEVDLIVRIYSTSTDTFVSKSVETRHVHGSLIEAARKVEFEKSTLTHLVLSQKKLLDYNGYYIAYILNQLTEEEFSKESEEFAFTPDEGNDEIKERILFIAKTFSDTFSISEIADLLKTTEHFVKDCLTGTAAAVAKDSQ